MLLIISLIYFLIWDLKTEYELISLKLMKIYFKSQRVNFLFFFGILIIFLLFPFSILINQNQNTDIQINQINNNFKLNSDIITKKNILIDSNQSSDFISIIKSIFPTKNLVNYPSINISSKVIISMNSLVTVVNKSNIREGIDANIILLTNQFNPLEEFFNLSLNDISRPLVLPIYSDQINMFQPGLADSKDKNFFITSSDGENNFSVNFKTLPVINSNLIHELVNTILDDDHTPFNDFLFIKLDDFLQLINNVPVQLYFKQINVQICYFFHIKDNDSNFYKNMNLFLTDFKNTQNNLQFSIEKDNITSFLGKQNSINQEIETMNNAFLIIANLFLTTIYYEFLDKYYFKNENKFLSRLDAIGVSNQKMELNITFLFNLIFLSTILIIGAIFIIFDSILSSYTLPSNLFNFFNLLLIYTIFLMFLNLIIPVFQYKRENIPSTRALLNSNLNWIGKSLILVLISSLLIFNQPGISQMLFNNNYTLNELSLMSLTFSLLILINYFSDDILNILIRPVEFFLKFYKKNNLLSSFRRIRYNSNTYSKVLFVFPLIFSILLSSIVISNSFSNEKIMISKENLGGDIQISNLNLNNPIFLSKITSLAEINNIFTFSRLTFTEISINSQSPLNVLLLGINRTFTRDNNSTKFSSNQILNLYYKINSKLTQENDSIVIGSPSQKIKNIFGIKSIEALNPRPFGNKYFTFDLNIVDQIFDFPSSLLELNSQKFDLIILVSSNYINRYFSQYIGNFFSIDCISNIFLNSRYDNTEITNSILQNFYNNSFISINSSLDLQQIKSPNYYEYPLFFLMNNYNIFLTIAITPLVLIILNNIKSECLNEYKFEFEINKFKKIIIKKYIIFDIVIFIMSSTLIIFYSSILNAYFINFLLNHQNLFIYFGIPLELFYYLLFGISILIMGWYFELRSIEKEIQSTGGFKN